MKFYKKLIICVLFVNLCDVMWFHISNDKITYDELNRLTDESIYYEEMYYKLKESYSKLWEKHLEVINKGD